jgi:hypothetical protein
MPQVTYTLDAQTSRLTARTGTVGMFSPLAHDLELTAQGITGEARDADGKFSARVEIPAGQLRVAGVVKRGRVEPDVLSNKDRAEIERRIREDVFRAAATLVAEVSGSGQSGQLELRAGTAGVVRVPLKLARVTRDEREARAEGECELSIKALGLPEVRGPLHAFRVADTVHVRFEVTFRAGG